MRPRFFVNEAKVCQLSPPRMGRKERAIPRRIGFIVQDGSGQARDRSSTFRLKAQSATLRDSRNIEGFSAKSDKDDARLLAPTRVNEGM